MSSSRFPSDPSSTEKPGLIRRVYRALMLFLSGLRVLITNLVFLLFLFIAFNVFFAGKAQVIPEKGALIINPQGTIVEQLSYQDPLSQLLGESDPYQSESELQTLIDALYLAKDDPRITAGVMYLDYLAFSGISKTQEIAKALNAFKNSGKKLIAIGSSYSQDQYFLASYADEIYAHPMGGVALQGFGVYRNYLRDAIDKLGINYHIFRVGSYKSAVEPLMRNSMSDEAKEANLLWLSDLWSVYSQGVASRRGLDRETVDKFINNYDQYLERVNGDAALAAQQVGLIDGMKSHAEMNRYLIEIVGAENEEGRYQGINYRRYNSIEQLVRAQEKPSDSVGVIIAQGTIVDGDQPPGTIGSDSISEIIRQARNDNSVKAVVLRIDSGGGSSFASEVIRNELSLLRDTGKPLVVSMGSVAASGGYWISAEADEIWATTTTLTGSIGIYGAFPTLENTLSKIGVTTDGVGTTKLAGSFRIDRPLQPLASRAAQLTVENGYQRFLSIVSVGRGMSIDEVDAVAQGRVWSGQQAYSNGLVDQLGGLDEAVESAARLANLSDYNRRVLEGPLTPQEQLLKQLNRVKAIVSPQVAVIPSSITRLLAPLKDTIMLFEVMNDPQNIYAHCASCIAP